MTSSENATLEYFQRSMKIHLFHVWLRQCEEEIIMLTEILNKTSRERARLEGYRDRVVDNGTEVAAIIISHNHNKGGL